MKKIFLLNLILSLNIYSGVTGFLEGNIKDSKTKNPIIGASIIIEGTRYGTTSNQNGHFIISNLPLGIYKVKFSMLGFVPLIVSDVKILPDFRTKISIELKESEIELAPVEIKADEDLIKRDQAATIYHIGSQKIEMLPVSKITEIVSLQPGTTIEGNIRGGKINDVLYLIDGIPVRDMISGGVNLQIPRGAISGVSIFTGGFDAEYGNALSGVVNLVTKSTQNEENLSLRVESDSWIRPEINKQQNKFFASELSLSGPIFENELTYFLSENLEISDTRWWQDFQNFFPSPVSKEINGIAKLDYSPNVLQKFSFQAIHSLKRFRDYEFSWRYNLDGLPKREQDALRILFSYTQMLNDETFYNLSFTTKYQNSKIGSGTKNEIEAHPYEYDFYLQYIIDGERSWWANATNLTYTLKTDLTSLIDEKHFLKLGGEINFFEIQSDLIKYEVQKTYFGKPILNAPLLNYSNSYNYKPLTGNIFLQDKIQIKEDGSNISFGLRWDFFNPQASRPIVEFIPINQNEYEQKISGEKKANFKQQLSPRFSVAAPLGNENYIFINYGYYFQLPLFDYLYSGITPEQIRFGAKNVQAGNIDLEPERTTLWEIGLKKEFSKDVIGSVTYFKKRMLNQIDTKTLIPFDSKSSGDYGFATYVNNSEANANGIEILINTVKKSVTGNLSYTFMITEGLSEYVDQTLNYAQWGFPLVTKPYPLSWDERHSVKGDFEFELPFEIKNNLVFFFSTPKPYTFYPTRDGFTPRDSGKVFLPNNSRMENLFFVNLKLKKNLTIDFAKIKSCEIYLDAQNLLNKKNIRWIDSSGRIGGELGDPSAYYSPRRIVFGIKSEW